MTKAQQRARDIAALEKRLKDIALGAYGDYLKPDFDGEEFTGMASELGLDAFARWLGGIKLALLSDKNKDLIEPRYLGYFDTIGKAAEMLYDRGIRA